MRTALAFLLSAFALVLVACHDARRTLTGSGATT